MKKYLKYILLFLALKPLITFFGYPENETRFVFSKGSVDSGRYL